MKKTIFFLLIISSIFFTAFIMAEENKGLNIPPGMEVRKIDGALWVVPKGILVHKVNDLVVLETANEYVARKIADMEDRLAKIEEEQKRLKDKIEG